MIGSSPMPEMILSLAAQVPTLSMAARVLMKLIIREMPHREVARVLPLIYQRELQPMALVQVIN